jgi:hypothetical protein
MRKIVLGIVTVLCFSGLRAQYASEALSYSQTDLMGTAAYVGRGGAIGALGADFTAASYNPAGLGMFYSSQLSISPSLDWSINNSTYMGNEEDESRTIFAFNNANALFAFKTGAAEGWRVFQFGLGVNKLRSFNNRTYLEGNPTNTSLLTVWTDNANSANGFDSYTSSLARICGLMSYDSVSGTYTNIFKGNIQELTQSQYKVESGGVSEMVVSMSGNYSDKLYLGATLGVPFLGYRSTSLYTETPTEVLDTIGLKEFSFWENKNIDGTGVNLKLGAIYRPIDNLRIGLAFHTPTYYEINESYSTTVESEILIPGRDKYRSSEANLYGIYYYNFTTPLKLLANMAVTMGNMSSKLAGSLSFDYEFTNYRSMRFSGGDKQYMKLVNEDIKNMYRPTHTFRVGGTLNVMKLAFRLGAVYTTDPYKENLERDAEKMTIACGVGYQTRSYFVDFAYAHTEQKDKMYFSANSTDIVSLTDYRNLFVLTIGMKF